MVQHSASQMDMYSDIELVLRMLENCWEFAMEMRLASCLVFLMVWTLLVYNLEFVKDLLLEEHLEFAMEMYLEKHLEFVMA